MLIPVYGSYFYCVVANTVEEGLAKLPRKVRARLKPTADTTGWAGGTFASGDGRVCTVLASADADVIGHELYHAVMAIAEFHALSLSYVNDEALAYLSGFVYKAMTETIRKSRKQGTTNGSKTEKPLPNNGVSTGS